MELEDLLEGIEISDEQYEELEDYFNDKINEGVRDYINSDEFKHKYKPMNETTESIIDSYLNKVINEFVEQSKFEINHTIKQEKMEALLEGFSSITLMSGVELSQIAQENEKLNEELNEDKDETINELQDLLNDSINENVKTKEKYENAVKIGIQRQIAEDLTANQKENFFNLVNEVPFYVETRSDYYNKLKKVANSLSESITKPKVKFTPRRNTIDEDVVSVEEVTLNENSTIGKINLDASHLY